MLKKTITYKDFNGESITEDFYFNLTQAELMEMNLTTEGGLDKLIEKIVNTKDVPQIVKIFKEIVLRSYGVKSDDGKRFIKSDELRDQFAQTNAYSDLFVSLATDENAASQFINGIVPAEVAEGIDNSNK